MCWGLRGSEARHTASTLTALSAASIMPVCAVINPRRASLKRRFQRNGIGPVFFTLPAIHSASHAGSTPAHCGRNVLLWGRRKSLCRTGPVRARKTSSFRAKLPGDARAACICRLRGSVRPAEPASTVSAQPERTTVRRPALLGKSSHFSGRDVAARKFSRAFPRPWARAKRSRCRAEFQDGKVKG